jgi:hypothetical protein
VDTVTAPAPVRPAYGTVEYYTDLLGPEAPSETLILRLVDQVVNELVLGEPERITHVRSLLAAATHIRAGLAAR